MFSVTTNMELGFSFRAEMQSTRREAHKETPLHGATRQSSDTYVGGGRKSNMSRRTLGLRGPLSALEAVKV